MSGKSFDISKVESTELFRVMTEIDRKHGNNSKIDKKKEWAELTDKISGSEKLKAELAKEGDDVKSLFGFTASQSTTETAKVQEVVTQPVAKEPSNELERYAKLKQEYITLREAGKGPNAAYKEVKEAYKKNKEYEKAIESLKNYAKHVDSQIDTIEAIGKSDAETSKQVKRDAKAVLAEQDGGKIDKWHKRAVNGNRNAVTWISGEDSAMKEVRKGQAWGNRAKRIEKDGVTMEAIVKRLGKDCPYLQTVKDKDGNNVTLLEAAGLMSKRADGKYDITELSHFVKDMGTGADNNQSRQENKSVREKKLLIAELNTRIKEETGVDLSHTRINDKYSKRLVKLTGRHVEKKNVIGNVYKNVLGGALAAAAGTAGALLMLNKDVTIFRSSNRDYLELNLQFEGSANIAQIYESFANDPAFQALVGQGKAALTQTGESVQVIIEQRDASEFIKIADKHIPLNTLRSTAIGAALGLLASALTYGKSEQEVIPHVTDCKTLDEFKTYIDSLVTNKAVKPLYGEIAKNIALYFTNEDGTLKCDEMNKFLGYEASNGSRLNRAELMSALKELMNRKEPPKQKACYEIEKQVDVEKEPNKEDDVATIDHAAKYGWTSLGRMYDCFEDMTDKQAWRAMQVIQAIDPDKVDGKYREDQIRAIVAKAFKESGNGRPDWNYINNELTKEFSFVNIETLKSVLSATYAGTATTAAEQRIKKGQEGYDKVNIVVAPVALYKADGTKACDRKDPNRDKTKYNKGDGTVRNNVKVSTHYTQEGAEKEVAKYRGRSGEATTDWKKTEAEADAAAKKKFPNAERCNNNK